MKFYKELTGVIQRDVGSCGRDSVHASVSCVRARKHDADLLTARRAPLSNVGHRTYT